MAVAFKKREFAGVSESLAARSALKLARATNQSKPVTSPARELQASLAISLNEQRPERSNLALGIIVGVLAGTFLTGLLIYAVS